MPKGMLIHERQDDILDALTVDVSGVSDDIVSSQALSAGETYTIPASSRITIDVSKVDTFDLFATITPDTSYSGDLEFTFEVSIDDSNWYEDSGDVTTMKNIVDGDEEAKAGVYVGSLPYVRVKKITNTDASYGITINKLVALVKS